MVLAPVEPSLAPMGTNQRGFWMRRAIPLAAAPKSRAGLRGSLIVYLHHFRAVILKHCSGPEVTPVCLPWGSIHMGDTPGHRQGLIRAASVSGWNGFGYATVHFWDTLGREMAPGDGSSDHFFLRLERSPWPVPGRVGACREGIAPRAFGNYWRQSVSPESDQPDGSSPGA